LFLSLKINSKKIYKTTLSVWAGPKIPTRSDPRPPARWLGPARPIWPSHRPPPRQGACRWPVLGVRARKASGPVPIKAAPLAPANPSRRPVSRARTAGPPTACAAPPPGLGVRSDRRRDSPARGPPGANRHPHKHPRADPYPFRRSPLLETHRSAAAAGRRCRPPTVALPSLLHPGVHVG
jgi:hypothetical protein